MTVYISLLRGINVGGKKSLKMADLRTLYESLGFDKVKSYVQSGNVVFTSDETATTIATTIHDAIAEKFAYNVHVMVYTVETWHKLMDANPFTNDSDKDPKHLHITLLDALPDEEAINDISAIDIGADDYIIIGKVVYLHCPNGYGRTKINNNFWEKKLKVSATTRNWNTVNKLLALATAL
jgi:uncharacterized protein (DUF1697 family)